jgi:translation elongation factor EF-4
MKKVGGAYRGVLKARISKLYGGDVTVAKAKKLKARKNATKRDVQLANWFINMQTAKRNGRKKN